MDKKDAVPKPDNDATFEFPGLVLTPDGIVDVHPDYRAEYQAAMQKLRTENTLEADASNTTLDGNAHKQKPLFTLATYTDNYMVEMSQGQRNMAERYVKPMGFSSPKGVVSTLIRYGFLPKDFGAIELFELMQDPDRPPLELTEDGQIFFDYLQKEKAKIALNTPAAHPPENVPNTPGPEVKGTPPPKASKGRGRKAAKDGGPVKDEDFKREVAILIGEGHGDAAIARLMNEKETDFEEDIKAAKIRNVRRWLLNNPSYFLQKSGKKGSKKKK